MKRAASLAVTLLLVGGATAACGGGGAPTDASKDDFCGVYEQIAKDMTELGADAKEADMVKAMKDAATKMEETGTPEDISDEARKGFELTIEAINDIPDDATMKDLEEIDKDYSKEDQDAVNAFGEYSSKTCPAG